MTARLWADAVVIAGGVVGRGARIARTDPDDNVFFNCAGVGVQDVAAAWAVVHAARGEGR
ncbi:hypothetical protein [Streptomyces sp. SID12488]|uniref:hypothetical protein n=1 Tax=Streptomyces sp. SID12488 TaxID=2706040 RepID=UPI0013DACD45|nr:hypothetical protein [Streptomyces sp. SID12488]NEA66928.1 hypothetical protein [Streptomyces sp. SID12488]